MSENKKNYLVYFYTYFTAQVVFIYVNVYLPVYFFNVLDVNRVELAFIQIFSYSAFFLKPLIAVYFDKENSIKKTLIIVSSFGMCIGFFFLTLSVFFLIVFGIFLGITFAFISIMDVAIDKIIVISSPNEKLKDKNALCIQLGAMMGAIVPNVISFMLFEDIYSKSTWDLFFLVGAISITPLIFISFLLKLNQDKLEEPQKITNSDVKMKMILLMCIYLFLVYADRLYNYPLEPWVLKKYGEEQFHLFLFFLIILVFINAIGVIVAGFISNKFDRRKLLILSTILTGVILIFLPFTDLIAFFILLGILQILAGFLLINIIAIMIKLSQKRVFFYQFMTAFIILASVIFVPLGTYLSSIIATEIIIIIAGILTILASIPLYFLEEISEDK